MPLDEWTAEKEGRMQGKLGLAPKTVDDYIDLEESDDET